MQDAAMNDRSAMARPAWPRRASRILLAAACAVQLVVRAGGADAEDAARPTVAVNSFPSAANLPIWAAQHRGFFGRAGLTVSLSHPAGSLDQFKGVADGRYPIIMTAFDNIIAYHEGQGPAEVGAIPDLVAIMGTDSGFLTLMAAPGITRIVDLKGRTLAVDALSTGFSFALRDILTRSGIGMNDVTYITAGSSGARWKKLQDGSAAAALLTLPVDLEAADKGFTALTTVTAVFGRYAANVAATRQGWAVSHKAELTAFLRGYRDGMRWLAAPEHKEEAIAILRQEMPELDGDKPVRVYAALVDRKTGLFRDLAIDPAGARTVVSLRERYARPRRDLGSYKTYVDMRYLRAALQAK